MDINNILKLKIILSTMGTVDILKSAHMNRGTFTHIFIDEAGQMTEPSTLHALCKNMLIYGLKQFSMFANAFVLQRCVT